MFFNIIFFIFKIIIIRNIFIVLDFNVFVPYIIIILYLSNVHSCKYNFLNDNFKIILNRFKLKALLLLFKWWISNFKLIFLFLFY